MSVFTGSAVTSFQDFETQTWRLDHDNATFLVSQNRSIMRLPGEMRNAIYEDILQIFHEQSSTTTDRGPVTTWECWHFVKATAEDLGGELEMELKSLFLSRLPAQPTWWTSWLDELRDVAAFQSTPIGATHNSSRVYNFVHNRVLEVAHTGVQGRSGVQNFLDSIILGDVLPTTSYFRRKPPLDLDRFHQHGPHVFRDAASNWEEAIWTSKDRRYAWHTRGTMYWLHTFEGIRVCWWQDPYFTKEVYWVWAFASCDHINDLLYRANYNQYQWEIVNEREAFINEVGIWPWGYFYRHDGRRRALIIPAVERLGLFKYE